MYKFSIEDGHANVVELVILYGRHYKEMQTRLASEGVEISDFNPRYQDYFEAFDAGHLLNFVIRDADGHAVGYSNIWLTNDMHNGDFIAQEDTIYVLPEHRNGIGRKFSQFILDDLRQRGVKRISVTAITDLRVAKLWVRMGFKHTAHHMTYTF